MEIIEIEIEKIKADPNQPRTSADEEGLKEMAQSMITEGVINPIETDEDFVIVTGERRWRAAKIAGLKTVPVKVIKIGKGERFMRQVIENIHNETISDTDMAHALKKLLEHRKEGKISDLSPGDKSLDKKIIRIGAKFGKTEDVGITWLSEKTGKSRAYIEEKLAILEASKSFQKAIKKGELAGTVIRAVKRTPEKYKKAIEKKILDNEFRSRDGAVHLAMAIDREKYNPEAVNELLAIDYSKYATAHEVGERVAEISPRLQERFKAAREPIQELDDILKSFETWAMNNPRSGIGSFFLTRVLINMNYTKNLIDAWLVGKENEF